MKKILVLALVLFWYSHALIQAPKTPLADPHTFSNLFNQGTQFFKNKEYEKAINLFEEALKIENNHAQPYFNIGLCYALLQNPDKAKEYYRKAIKQNPKYTKAMLHLAGLLKKAGEKNESMSYYQLAVEQEPLSFEAQREYARLLHEQNNFEEAEHHFAKAVHLRPENPHLRLEWANTLNVLSQFEKALEQYYRIYAALPNSPSVQYNIAYTLKRIDRIKPAIELYKKVLEQKPDYAEAHFSLGTAYLVSGDFENGWPEYEWRWKKGTMKERKLSKPQWSGESLEGKILLIHAEQGLGDTLQFIRYAKVAKKMGATVIAAVQKPLIQLLQECPYIDHVRYLFDPFPAYDVHVPLLSFPHVLKTTVETIPDEVPYLYVDKELDTKWTNVFKQDTNFKIGICWQGNPNYSTHFLRAAVAGKSLHVKNFEALTKIPGVTVYSLQRKTGTEQLNDLPEDFELHVFDDHFDVEHGAFMDTAAVMKQMDLIITVDTSPAHLAGGLGIPTWILIPNPPDWRWMLKRTDSPWYPENVRLFRQPTPGDWQSVMQTIVNEVQKKLGIQVPTPSVPIPSGSGQTKDKITAEIAIGELLDKITILEIKKERISDKKKLKNINTELNSLRRTLKQMIKTTPELEQLVKDLKQTNATLWDIEDAIREKERQKRFDLEFIELARSVYIENDKRCAIKRKINAASGSQIIEEKSYKPY